jgi:hypothetical protein
MKIVRLEIEDDSILSGLDAMALVESPAIEDGFFAFSAEKFAETYTDYPQAAVDAAKQGIKRNEETGNKCATQVGKVRAQQLANREPVSLDTVRRMRSFLLRQRDNYELAQSRRDYTACGYISYLLWGGPAALPWAEKTLRQAGEEFAEIGPRGGVKESPKAPKSDTPNPDPKGEGTAKGDASSSRGAEVDAKTEESLKKKADEFNEKYKDKLGYGANVGALKSVYQRGLGAYNTSRSPSVAAAGGAKQWAMARVNAFLFLIKNGRPQNRNYTQDNDLLPKDHPKRKEFKQILESIMAQKMVEQMMLDVSALPNFLNEPTGKLSVNKEASYGFAAVEDQQILVGPAMVPGKLIPRRDENGDTYFVYFTKDTIKKIAYKAMKDKVIDRVNIEHESGKFVDDVYLIESWIVVNPATDKAREYGLNPTEGTWMVMYKVDNLDVWQGYVVPGLIRGFSIEGYFTEELIK